MSIEKYLHQLLCSNECVIVPGLGGFITNYQPAKINPHTFLFEPPSKFLVFNPGLTTNDGLLATFISEKENINFDAAMERIWREVTSWQERLKAGKTITLLGIGSFHLNPEGKIVFEPDKQENYLDDVYGMASFVMPPVSHAARIRNFRRKTFTTARMRKFAITTAITLPLVAAIVLGVLNKETVAGFAMQSAGFVQTLVRDITDRFTTSEKGFDAPVVDKAIEPATPPLPEVPLATQPESPEALPTYTYHVISGAFRNQENAQNLAEQLMKQGYPIKILGSDAGMHLVSVASFFSFDDAMKKANALKKNFPGAWVHKQ